MKSKSAVVVLTLVAGLCLGLAFTLQFVAGDYVATRVATVIAAFAVLAILGRILSAPTPDNLRVRHITWARPTDRLRKRFAALSVSTGFALCLYMRGLIWNLFWDNYRFWNEMWWTIQC